jgi:hypothetical protein
MLRIVGRGDDHANPTALAQGRAGRIAQVDARDYLRAGGDDQLVVHWALAAAD